jgi:hypothetical protein
MTPLQLLLHNPLQSIAALLLLFGVLFFPILLLIPLSIHLYSLSRAKRPTPLKQRTYRPYQPTGNQYMSAAEKSTYLSSPAWRHLRKQVLSRDSYTCQLTGATTNLQVHHIHYHSLGNESLSDLVTLSAPAHDDLHKLLGYDRDGDFSLSTYLHHKNTQNT